MTRTLSTPLPRTTPSWLAALGTFVLLGVVGGLLGIVVGAPMFVTLGLGLATVGVGAQALSLVRSSRRTPFTELALIGSALCALMIPVAAGLIAASGLLRSPGIARLGGLCGFALAALFALPVLFRGTRFARRQAREWRSWTGFVLCVTALALVAAAIAAVLRPHVFAVDAGVAIRAPFAVVGVSVSTRLGWRVWRLGRVGSEGCDTAAFGWLAIGLSGVCLMDGRLFSVAWWVGHLLVLGGVWTVGLGLRAAVHSGAPLEVFEPVLTRDPLYALDLATTSLVQDFCAGLAAQSTVDRDHVRRVAELAVRAGEVAGVRGRKLRDLGIAAVLHDVGKRIVPEHILSKRARLHPDEYAQVQLHAAEGERMLAACPTLAAAAPIVRWHHERIDGRGYPDRLVGDAIPMEAMIVSVCDAFDAMVSDRSYRRSLGVTRALSVLAEHAGSQWDPRAVAAVESVVKRGRLPQALVTPTPEPRGRAVPFIYLDGLPSHIDEAIAPRNPVVDSIADLMRR